MLLNMVMFKVTICVFGKMNTSVPFKRDDIYLIYL